MARLIEKLRPRWAICENVRGFVSQPMGLERSLSDLARIGYQAVPFIIPACAVDALHRRDRVWMVAYADSKRSQGVGANNNSERREKSTQRPAGLCDGTTGAKRWPTEPDVGRVANGISNRSHRLKGLGNSVVPQIPMLIGEAILKTIKEESCIH